MQQIPHTQHAVAAFEKFVNRVPALRNKLPDQFGARHRRYRRNRGDCVHRSYCF